MRMSQKIVPHLWFDKEAKEAAEFYASVFPHSKVTSMSVIHDTPSGDCDVVSFEIAGYKFQAISAGPLFKFNPSISFMVNFDPVRDDGASPVSNGVGPSQEAQAREELDRVWDKLSQGGTVRMELGEYPFSKRYGWVADKYGVDWQLMLTDPKGEKRPFVIPSFLFVTETGNIAEEATDFYLSVFRNAKRGTIVRYPAGSEPNKEGSVMFTDFMLENQWFAAMDGSSKMHKFAFNEAISFIVNCDTQEEIDYYSLKLSAHPDSEQCGWLKDKYGVSWQIVPTVMDEMMSKGTPEQIARVTKAFLKMKKFNITELENAFDGK